MPNDIHGGVPLPSTIAFALTRTRVAHHRTMMDWLRTGIPLISGSDRRISLRCWLKPDSLTCRRRANHLFVLIGPCLSRFLRNRVITSRSHKRLGTGNLRKGPPKSGTAFAIAQGVRPERWSEACPLVEEVYNQLTGIITYGSRIATQSSRLCQRFSLTERSYASGSLCAASRF